MATDQPVRRLGSGVVHLARDLGDVATGKILGAAAKWSERPVQALCGATLRPPVVLMATNKGLCRPCAHVHAGGTPAPARRRPRPPRAAQGGTAGYRCVGCGQVFVAYRTWERHSDETGHRRMVCTGLPG